jgi:hypothetical protein
MGDHTLIHYIMDPMSIPFHMYAVMYCVGVVLCALRYVYMGRRTHTMDPTIARAWAQDTRTHSMRTPTPTYTSTPECGQWYYPVPRTPGKGVIHTPSVRQLYVRKADGTVVHPRTH